MPKHKYQTYVFNHEFDDEEDAKRNVKVRGFLGPEYHGGVPVRWSVGNELGVLDRALTLLRKLHDDEESEFTLCRDAHDLIEDFFTKEDVCRYD